MRAPRGSTPEDELLVQFQGMIAEYERAQILERSRRGKRHRARQGEVSVLSGAPFGYRFIRKTDHSAAYYQIDEEQARIVRRVFELYTTECLSIGAIVRLLNEQAIPTYKRRGRWERSTVWGMLRNPAYKGQACFGKTTMAPRQRITRPIRLRGGIAFRKVEVMSGRERIGSRLPYRRSSAMTRSRLRKSGSRPTETHAPRRTITPSIVQRRREQADDAELQAIVDQSADRAAYLRLAETLTTFLTRLRSSADVLDISERQRVLRLLVKDILVSDDKIIIRHSIPLPTGSDGPSARSVNAAVPSTESYLLRSWSHNPALWRASFPRNEASIRHLHGRLQPSFDVEKHPRTVRVFADRTHQQVYVDAIEEVLDVKIEHPCVAPASLPRLADRIERRFTGPVPIRVRVETRLHQWLKIPFGDRLGDSVGDRGDTQWPRPTLTLRDLNPTHRWRMITARRQPVPELVEVVRKISLKVCNRLIVDACRSLVGSNPLVRFPYLPFRNVKWLCSIHAVPPIAG